jgi:hypothetical protein
MTSALVTAGLTATMRSLPVDLPRLVMSPTATGRGCLVVLLRLAYLGVTNALAMLRLLASWVRLRGPAPLWLLARRTPLSRRASHVYPRGCYRQGMVESGIA